MIRRLSGHQEFREISYSADRWTMLTEFRKKASRLMRLLQLSNIESTVHGSIARGDVFSSSDVDIFIPSQSSSFSIESALEGAGIPIARRTVIQATPNYAMKAYIEIDERTTISFPLMKLRKIEREFYRFGGEANLGQLDRNLRVVGVDKRLMLIEPTKEGHIEGTIKGHEEQTASLLHISVETVLNRVRVLTRRDRIGRTGVFIKREVHPNETFEMILNRVAEENPAVRRRISNC